MFVEESYRQSPEYREFWAALNRGEYSRLPAARANTTIPFSTPMTPIGKGGTIPEIVWIQASYNTPIKGRHHSIFVSSPPNSGQPWQAAYKVVKEVWIQASYRFSSQRQTLQGCQIVTDVTHQKLVNGLFGADRRHQVNRRRSSSSMMDGTIVTANDNFLKTVLGYTARRG
jgi:methyl-accepting chemotaxis protein